MLPAAAAHGAPHLAGAAAAAPEPLRRRRSRRRRAGATTPAHYSPPLLHHDGSASLNAYSEEELEDILLAWVADPSYELPARIQKVDLYKEECFEDLKQYACDGAAYFALKLTRAESEKPSQVNYYRKMGKKRHRWEQANSRPSQSRICQIKVFKYKRHNQYMRDRTMTEVTVKDNSSDLALCVVSSPEWVLPEDHDTAREGGGQTRPRFEAWARGPHPSSRTAGSIRQDADDVVAGSRRRPDPIDENLDLLDLQLLPGEPPTWGEEDREKEKRAEMAVTNDEIIEALLGEVMLSDILRNEEQNALQELQNQNSSLRNALQKLEAEKRDVLKSLGDEKKARIAVESSRNEILEDLKKATLEEKRLNDQVKMLQNTNKTLQDYNASLQLYNTKLQSDAIAKLQNEKCLNDQVEMLQNTNKRLQDYNGSLQQYNSDLQSEARKNNETIAKLQKEKNTMVETMNGLKDHTNSVKNQFDLSKASHTEAVKQKNDLLKEVDGLRSELQRVREDRDSKSAQVDSLMSDLRTYKELTGKSVAELDDAVRKSEVCEATIKSQSETIRTLEIKLAAATEKLKMCDLTAVEAMAEHEKQKKIAADLQSRLEVAVQQITDGDKLRKKLHNTILEMKGKIRVFCRVRGLQSNESEAVTCPKGGEDMDLVIKLNHNAQPCSFTFDKVFDHSASQEDVFSEISQLVQSALDGYKVCIFAYGQTGSGKTYTMMGNPEVEDQKGMIPRSLEQIFRDSKTLYSQGWKYKMQVSMLEIYNETIRDLLSTNHMATQVGGSSKYNIKHDANGNTDVSDLTVVDVASINEVYSLLKQAAQNRSIARTQMNEESSRSHCVFTIRILGVNERKAEQVQGVLNLIDLAGSERLNKSGATGDRLKETQAINKSLSMLGDVISAIAKKDDHVPFRNTKLTYLLQPCLQGASKMLMFVTLSPESSSAGESLCSLKFAARVNSCQIGIPRRQTHA